MAESSETESVLSLQIDPASKDTQYGERRFFALYLLNSSRSIRNVVNSDIQEELTTDNLDGSSCLIITATNLAAHTETDLRNSLSHKLTSKTRLYKEGHVYSVGLSVSDSVTTSASCYYCVVTSSSDSLGFDHVTKEGIAEDSDFQEFVVCFISFQESSLDLFRGELDDYTQGLIPYLDKEHPEITVTRFKNNSNTSPTTDKEELSQLSEGIHNYLQQWPSVVLGFLSRTMQCMGPSIQHLIYAALLNANVQVTGASEQLEQDIKKFIQCCSLSGLLERPEPQVGDGNKDESEDIWQLQPITVSVSITDDVVVIDRIYDCKFCKNAADKLVSQDQSNVTKMREFLESVKLAFAHNLNKFKRYLAQGEVDFYALYRALSYLRNCGCGDLLLRYVKMGATQESQSVIDVIESFIKEIKCTLS